jgi:hypothetical protein
LTVALKTLAGTDPSSTDPIYILFRNATAGTGDYTVITVSSALSLVVSSGSTLGTQSGLLNRLYITCSNDAGTPRLGIYNPYNSTGPTLIGLDEGVLYSSTAEGGAGGADSAQVIYTGTAVATKAIRILGYIESTQATAGTWATTPSKVQIMSQGSHTTGSVVQVLPTLTGAVATGATDIPSDDSIPQIGEGDEYMTRTITPSSAANILKIEVVFNGGYALGSAIVTAALFQDATANALAAAWTRSNANDSPIGICFCWLMRAGTASSTTLRLRAGGNAANTLTFNGVGGARRFGGVMASSLTVTEIFA